MMRAPPYDAAVIGGGVNGLAAAAYLARAGQRVVLLEKNETFGGLCHSEELHGMAVPLGAHSVFALDSKIVRDLGLARYGFRCAAKDLPLVALHPGGEHLVISCSNRATARSIAAHSAADARAWAGFRRELFWLSRAANLFLWRDGPLRKPRWIERQFDRLARTSAVAWLDAHFESDFLKAALLFDSMQGGLSPLEPGSALALVWRAAQHNAGMPGAASFPAGGPAALADALAAAARQAGAELRTRASVAEVSQAADGAFQIGFAGETLLARHVILALSNKQAVRILPPGSLGLARTSEIAGAVQGYAAASIVLEVQSLPPFIGGPVPYSSRFLVAPGVERLLAAQFAANASAIPDIQAFEMIVPSLLDASMGSVERHFVNITVRPVPVLPPRGWNALKAELIARVVAAIEQVAPGFSGEITGARALTPEGAFERFGAECAGGKVTAERLIASWRERLLTTIPGLVLGGATAAPIGAVSGRAGRIAAGLVLGTGPRA